MTEAINDRELEAVLKLIEITQAGILIWRSGTAWGDMRAMETRKYAQVFLADFEKKILRLYVEESRVDKPNPLVAMANLGLNLEGRTYPYWSERMVLQITNTEGASLWTFPSKPAIRDLMTAVKRQVAGVNALIDSLLSIDVKR